MSAYLGLWGHDEGTEGTSFRCFRAHVEFFTPSHIDFLTKDMRCQPNCRCLLSQPASFRWRLMVDYATGVNNCTMKTIVKWISRRISTNSTWGIFLRIVRRTSIYKEESPEHLRNRPWWSQAEPWHRNVWKNPKKAWSLSNSICFSILLRFILQLL
jgi:hypothetical protein